MVGRHRDDGLPTQRLHELDFERAAHAIAKGRNNRDVARAAGSNQTNLHALTAVGGQLRRHPDVVKLYEDAVRIAKAGVEIGALRAVEMLQANVQLEEVTPMVQLNALDRCARLTGSYIDRVDVGGSVAVFTFRGFGVAQPAVPVVEVDVVEPAKLA